MESDEQLLEQFLQGDEAAFEQIVERHEARLRNTAFGLLRDRALAEDVAQESFLQAYRGAASFRGQGRVRNWLYRIVVNRARDELRSIRRRSEIAVAEPEAEEALEGWRIGNAEGEARANELRRQLAGALARMREEHRTPLVLRDVEGLTYSEIAALLGWPLGTVQTRIHRGRLELRALLGYRGARK
jgi:RNA polymerase sigma-70 factor (ECF subfamily)